MVFVNRDVDNAQTREILNLYKEPLRATLIVHMAGDIGATQND